jgi:hypothetical protein
MHEPKKVLAMVAAGSLTTDEALEMLDHGPRGMHCTVSRRGAVSLDGLQRLPVTLYADQWERLLGFADEIRAFIKAHKSELAYKDGQPSRGAQ